MTTAVTETPARPRPPDATPLTPLELATTSRTLTNTPAEHSPPAEPPPHAVSATSLPTSVKLKIASTYTCFLLAGLNDGSLGALIPYIRAHYSLGPDLVALVYIPTFLGWLTAAAINVHLHAALGTGGSLVAGGVLIAASALIRVFTPAYAVFAFAFFLGALGMAIQDAQANTFVAGLAGQHRWLGFLHAMFGLGMLISPLAATTLATQTARWERFYWIIMGCGVFSSVLAAVAFRDRTLQRVVRAGRAGARTEELGRRPLRSLVGALKLRAVWIVSLFYFCYLGAILTIGGWVVEFLVHTRDEDIKVAGYMPLALHGGLFLGRVILTEVMHRFGERRMAFGCIVLVLVFQLIFWLVPNVPTNGVALGFIGFFSGPLFATGMSVSTKLIPKTLHVAAVGYIFVIGQVGAAAFPFITGVAANKHGPQVLQPIATALLGCTGAAWLCIPRKEVEHEGAE